MSSSSSSSSSYLTNLLYSTDASIFELTPSKVFVPSSTDDLINLFNSSINSGNPVTIRGAATSLTGQSIGNGVVIDTTKYLNHILEYNIEERWVKVEPGISCAEVNKFFSQYSLSFAPDPATLSRATIGGMIANNSAGMRSIIHGMTCDHVISLRILLSSGQIVELSDNLDYFSESSSNSFGSNLFNFVKEVQNNHANHILTKYPSVIRHSGGYALDSLIASPNPNLSRLICGSEGTLGVILDATIKLTPVKPFSRLYTLFFPSILEALSCVPALVDSGCSALEFIDNNILRLYSSTTSCPQIIKNQTYPDNVLLILEYTDTSIAALDTKNDYLFSLAADLNCTVQSYIQTSDQEFVWDIRRNALGSLNKIPSSIKPIPYIEDAAIPVNSLSSYISDVLAICDKYSVPVTMFGHASVGLIHIRPLHDLHVPGEYDLIRTIQNEVFQLVCQYKGSWSGEHGDGLIRADFNLHFFGSEIFSLFIRLKNIFDPLHLMNPGKIIPNTNQPISFRSDLPNTPINITTAFQFKDSGGFYAASNKCTGVGNCRKTTFGIMCPSYMASKDELFSTRARSNSLRLLTSGNLPHGFFQPGLDKIFNSCLSCKGCTNECPNSVDIPRLKSEFHYQRGDFKSLRGTFFSHQSLFSRLSAGPQSHLINCFIAHPIGSTLISSLLNLSPSRTLPQFSSYRLSEWAAKHNDFKSGKAVVLFLDNFIDCFNPEVGIAAIKILNFLGYQVILTPYLDSQRSSISQGNLDKARARGFDVMRLLSTNYPGLPILFSEPSSFSSLTQDLPDLVFGTYSQDLDNFIFLDQFLADSFDACSLSSSLKPIRGTTSVAFVHTHCHQMATIGSKPTMRLLNNIPDLQIIESNSGCCGMSGSFGYEKENFDMSFDIASLSLLPSINSLPSDAFIVTNGFSCRHQVIDFSDRHPIHSVELLAKALPPI